MAAMFTMMNNARLGVGVQTRCKEGAYQHASPAQDRKQGKAPGTGTIIEHADVRRMLAEMKADILLRAIALMNATAIDMATATGDAIEGPRSPSDTNLQAGTTSESKRQAKACRCMAAWASSKKQAPRNIRAMSA